MPLNTIANRLGFKEASSFHPDFKNWTGVAPGEYRLSHTRDAPAPAPDPRSP